MCPTEGDPQALVAEFEHHASCLVFIMQVRCPE